MSDTEIESPCLDDRNLNDKERLQDRLEWEGYTEKKMKSDGNCQFRAIADQVYKSAKLHKLVRQEIVKQLKSRPQLYKGFVVGMEFKEYVKNMSSDSVWGDEITLQAAASVYGVKIVVITSSKYQSSFVVLPKSQKEPDKVIHLSYLEGIHYNSIHLKQDSGTGTGKKNKEEEKEKEKEEKEKEEKKEERKKEKEEKRREKEEDKKSKREKTVKKNKNKLHRRSHLYDDMSMPLE